MAEVSTKMTIGEKVKKLKNEYVNANTMVTIGIVISFFVPFVGQILSLIGLKKMAKSRSGEEELDDQIHKECEETLKKAKATVNEIVEQDKTNGDQT